MKAVEFGTLFQFIRNGMNVKQDKSGDGLPITRIETISDATVDGSRVGFAGLHEEDCSDWFLEVGDILFSHINSVEHVGKCAVYRGTPEKLVHGMNLLCLRCDTAKLLPEFAKYLMRGIEFRTRLSNFINKAVNQASVSIGNLKTIPVTVPPLAEQRRIAEVLDRAEALRAKRRAALAELDSLTQSLFLDLFGDPVTNSKGWKCVDMPNAVVGKYGIKAGPFGSSLKKEDYTTSGYRIYGQEQVIAGRFDIGDYYIGERKYQQLKSCAVAPGDLLVSLVGSFGKVLIVPAGIEPGIINPRLLKITPNQAIITPDFLASLLQHPTVQAEFQRVAHGGTMGILNAGLLKQLKVILPPIALQQEFARRVGAVEKLKAAQRTALAEQDALFATLQHRAFRGEL